MTKKWIWVGIVLSIAACGSVPATSDGGDDDGDDAGGPSDGDAGPGETTDAIGGEWLYTMGDADDLLECAVSVGLGTYEIHCPYQGLPWDVATDCRLETGETRIVGSLKAAFDGQVDSIVTYQGAGCSVAGYQAGIPLVEPAALLGATHDDIVPHGGFWSAMGGLWGFIARNPDNPAEMFGCACRFELGGQWSVECPGETTPYPMVPACAEQHLLRMHGTISPTEMQGSFESVTRYIGSGCAPAGLPEEIVQGSVPMVAQRQ